MNINLSPKLTKITYKKCLEDRNFLIVHNAKKNVVFVDEKRLFCLSNDSDYGFKLYEINVINKSNNIKKKYKIAHFEGFYTRNELYNTYDKAIIILKKYIKDYYNSTFSIHKNSTNKLYFLDNSYDPEYMNKDKHRFCSNLDFIRAMPFSYPLDLQHQNNFFSKMGYIICIYKFSKMYSYYVILPKKIFSKINDLIPDPSILKKVL